MALFCAGFQETPASADVMPQGAGLSGDRGGQIKRGPRKSAAFVGNQTGVRKHRGFESHTLRQIKKRGPHGPFLRRFSRNAGQCRRHAAGSRPFRRPRRSNQKGPPQKRSFCGEPNRRAQAPWVRIPHSPPKEKRPVGAFSFSL